MNLKTCTGMLVGLYCNAVTLSQTTPSFTLRGQFVGLPLDTITVTMNHFNLIQENFERYNAILDSTGRFTIQIPLKNRLGDRMIQVTIKSINSITTLLNGDYPIESGDNILVKYNHENSPIKAVFTGAGAAKYNCSQRLAAEMAACIHKLKEIPDIVLQNYQVIEQYFSRLAAVLLKYQKHIRPKMRDLLRADMAGELYGSWFTRLSKLKLIISINQFTRCNDKSFNQNTIVLSKLYRVYLMMRCRYTLIASHSGQNINYADVYWEEKKVFHGMVRDLLLVTALKANDAMSPDQINSDSSRRLWQDAAIAVTVRDLQEYAGKKSIYKKKGAVLPAGLMLEDTAGKKVDIAQFKGRVMLIDVWFTGCTSCAKYNKWMGEEVNPLFKENPGVVFISISADKNRLQWLASVRGGKYSQPGNVNLYSCGQGFDNNLLKYYEFDRGGVVLLVGKDGKIFNAELPHNNGPALIAQINKALEAP